MSYEQSECEAQISDYKIAVEKLKLEKSISVTEIAFAIADNEKENDDLIQTISSSNNIIDNSVSKITDIENSNKILVTGNTFEPENYNFQEGDNVGNTQKIQKLISYIGNGSKYINEKLNTILTTDANVKLESEQTDNNTEKKLTGLENLKDKIVIATKKLGDNFFGLIYNSPMKDSVNNLKEGADGGFSSLVKELQKIKVDVNKTRKRYEKSKQIDNYLENYRKKIIKQSDDDENQLQKDYGEIKKEAGFNSLVDKFTDESAKECRAYKLLNNIETVKGEIIELQKGPDFYGEKFPLFASTINDNVSVKEYELKNYEDELKEIGEKNKDAVKTALLYKEYKETKKDLEKIAGTTGDKLEQSKIIEAVGNKQKNFKTNPKEYGIDKIKIEQYKKDLEEAENPETDWWSLPDWWRSFKENVLGSDEKQKEIDFLKSRRKNYETARYKGRIDQFTKNIQIREKLEKRKVEEEFKKEEELGIRDFKKALTLVKKKEEAKGAVTTARSDKIVAKGAKDKAEEDKNRAEEDKNRAKTAKEEAQSAKEEAENKKNLAIRKRIIAVSTGKDEATITGLIEAEKQAKDVLIQKENKLKEKDRLFQDKTKELDQKENEFQEKTKEFQEKENEFNKLDNKFTTLNTKYDALDEKLPKTSTALKSKIDDFEGKLQEIENDSRENFNKFLSSLYLTEEVPKYSDKLFEIKQAETEEKANNLGFSFKKYQNDELENKIIQNIKNNKNFYEETYSYNDKVNQTIHNYNNIEIEEIKSNYLDNIKSLDEEINKLSQKILDNPSDANRSELADKRSEKNNCIKKLTKLNEEQSVKNYRSKIDEDLVKKLTSDESIEFYQGKDNLTFRDVQKKKVSDETSLKEKLNLGKFGSGFTIGSFVLAVLFLVVGSLAAESLTTLSTVPPFWFHGENLVGDVTFKKNTSIFLTISSFTFFAVFALLMVINIFNSFGSDLNKSDTSGVGNFFKGLNKSHTTYWFFFSLIFLLATIAYMGSCADGHVWNHYNYSYFLAMCGGISFFFFCYSVGKIYDKNFIWELYHGEGKKNLDDEIRKWEKNSKDPTLRKNVFQKLGEYKNQGEQFKKLLDEEKGKNLSLEDKLKDLPITQTLLENYKFDIDKQNAKIERITKERDTAMGGSGS